MFPSRILLIDRWAPLVRAWSEAFSQFECVEVAEDEDFTVIVTADHGGSGMVHNDGSLASTQIPWIAWGSGVRPQTLPNGIRTVDTAATILSILGLSSPADCEGKIVANVYRAPAR